LGWPREDLIGRKLHELTHYLHRNGSAFPARECAELQVLQSGVAVENSEDTFIRKDGSFFDVMYSASPLRREGSIVGLTVVFRDVTAERQAKKTIERSASWLRNLINTTQDAVLSIDGQARIVMFNPAAERIFEYTRAEVIGQKVNMLMGEPYRSEHDSYIERYERTGVAHAIGKIRTVTARRKSGELFPIELSVTKVSEDDDVQYAAFIRDISEKTRLQAQLIESERLAAIGTMAAKIGHEIGNPLNGMSLTIQLLETRLSERKESRNPEAAAGLRRLKNEIARLTRLSGEFRVLSRREPYDFVPTQISILIESILDLQLPQFEKQGIEVRNHLSTDLPTINADPDKISQAFLNLIKNAVEAMPRGGVLSIEARVTANRMHIEVADTGGGIAADLDPFEAFTTTKDTGTGLGLAIVRRIITAHNGSISYRSQVGEGTTFEIQLPLNFY
jgi:two-component system sensor kinase FixL